MPSFRVEINAKIVKKAADQAQAATDSDLITDLFDKRQHYLQLRQRGTQCTWFVRARNRSQKIGVANSIRGEFDRGFLSIKAARDLAATVYAGIETPAPSARKVAIRWSWADLNREYQAMMAAPRWINNRRKPSAGTCDDVRLAFARSSFTALHAVALTELTRPQVAQAIAAITSHRQRGRIPRTSARR